MNKLEAFKKLSAAFWGAATDEAVISAAGNVQNAENIADALEAFAEALEIQNAPADPPEDQDAGDA